MQVSMGVFVEVRQVGETADKGIGNHPAAVVTAAKGRNNFESSHWPSGTPNSLYLDLLGWLVTAHEGSRLSVCHL